MGFGNNALLVDAALEMRTQALQLSRAQQLADRIDRVGFLQEQSLIQCSTIALATVIPAADKLYRDAAGKVFGAIT